MGRNLQFEELQQPEPGFEGAVELVDPPAGKGDITESCGLSGEKGRRILGI
jgi:hypothetical protein